MISTLENAPTAAGEVTLPVIETATRRYAGDLALLRDAAAALDAQLEAIKAAALPNLRRLSARLATKEVELTALIEAAPQLFIKPRTYVFDSIEVGIEKQRGKTVFLKPEVVVERIKKLFPERLDELVTNHPKPNKKALGKLPAADLKRLGCTITDSADAVIIRPVETDADRLISLLLGAAVEAEVNDLE
jgi:hypothetical protein